MQPVRPLSLALTNTALTAPSWAAQLDPHKAPHPADSASAEVTKCTSGKIMPETVRMAVHMKNMQQGMGMVDRLAQSPARP